MKLRLSFCLFPILIALAGGCSLSSGLAMTDSDTRFGTKIAELAKTSHDNILNLVLYATSDEHTAITKKSDSFSFASSFIRKPYNNVWKMEARSYFVFPNEKDDPCHIDFSSIFPDMGSPALLYGYFINTYTSYFDFDLSPIPANKLYYLEQEENHFCITEDQAKTLLKKDKLDEADYRTLLRTKYELPFGNTTATFCMSGFIRGDAVKKYEYFHGPFLQIGSHLAKQLLGGKVIYEYSGRPEMNVAVRDKIDELGVEKSASRWELLSYSAPTQPVDRSDFYSDARQGPSGAQLIVSYVLLGLAILLFAGACASSYFFVPRSKKGILITALSSLAGYVLIGFGTVQALASIGKAKLGWFLFGDYRWASLIYCTFLVIGAICVLWARLRLKRGKLPKTIDEKTSL